MFCTVKNAIFSETHTFSLDFPLVSLCFHALFAGLEQAKAAKKHYNRNSLSTEADGGFRFVARDFLRPDPVSDLIYIV